MLALRHCEAPTRNLSDRPLTVDDALLIAFVYPAANAIHELAHGLVARAYGAEVRETGIMFLVFFPVPHVDASGADAFRSKWRRAAVALAGIMAELALSAGAMIAWTMPDPAAAAPSPSTSWRSPASRRCR